MPIITPDLSNPYKANLCLLATRTGRLLTKPPRVFSAELLWSVQLYKKIANCQSTP